MKDLLQSINLPSPKKGSVPLFLEFNINDVLKPFLVSSTRDLIWVYKTKNNRVRSALRNDFNINTITSSILEKIISQGLEYSWGNIYTGGLSRLEQAKSRMVEYGFPDFEILSSDQELVASRGDLTFSPCIPQELLVVVPRDREYLGFIGTFQDIPGKFCVLIHNASRGICILKP